MSIKPTKVVHYNGKSEGYTVYNNRWWTEKEPHEDITRIVKRIRTNNETKHKKNLFLAQLYENEEITGFGAGLYSSKTPQNARTQRLTVNVIKSCVDTLVSRVGTNKPRPMAITDDALWHEQQRAEKLTSYLEGLFEDIGMWRLGRLALRDACVLGTGVLKLHNSSGKVAVDRVIIDELMVDETEAIYGEPRSLYQGRFIAREVLCGMFKEYEEQITACDQGVDAAVVDGRESDMVLVTESWHLPSAPDADDGRHCITINNCTLWDKPWKRNWFPFLFLKYSDRLLGFYGKALSEEIVGIQLEINMMLRTIAQAQKLFCTPQVWLEAGSKALANNLTNEIGAARYYMGQPPVFATPNAMPPEYYNHFETLYRRAFEITGISQMSAQSQKPAGITSGVALRTVQDVESDRFKWTSQKYDEMFLQAAHMIVDLNDELLKESKVDPRVKVKKGEGIKSLNWSDVRMDLEGYTMRLFPTSLLPSTPEGKYERVQEMVQGGFLDQEDATALMDFPDIRAVTRRKLSPRTVILKILGDIIESGSYRSPEPYMDLNLAKQLAQLTYLDCIVKGVPTSRCDLIQTFMSDVDALMDEAAKQEQEQQPSPDQQPPPDAPMDPGAEGMDPAMMQQPMDAAV